MTASGRSLGRRLLRFAAWVVGLWLAVTILAVLTLRWVDPPTTAFMLDSRLSATLDGDTKYRVRYQWVDYRNISRHAALAVIAAEDQRFPDHWGFDLKSIDDSIRQARNGKRLRGASTISQQVAKNLFLWKSQSFVRKGLEAYFTVLIETLWPKQRIIEVYLNVAEFGRGVYGVGAASRYFLGKRAAHLTASESALLAAVLPNPRRFKVNAPSSYVLTRRDWILWQMHGLGGTQYLFALETG
jgi:monofunctional glycosyltransferase